MKKYLHRIMFLILVTTILLTGKTVKAATIEHSGTCGSLEWSIDSDGVFRLSGSGDYINYIIEYEDGVYAAAWYPYRDEIKEAVIDVTNITSLEFMFLRCSNLIKLDLSKLDTSKLTCMSYMFKGCDSLTQLDVSNFDTSKVTDMSYMFEGCGSLTQLDVSNFDTSEARDMDGMFRNCSSLTSVDLSNFNTSKVMYMRDMFSGCGSLRLVDVSSFDTSKLTSMDSMFFGCSSLTSVDLSNFNTSNITDMGGMFFGCSSLTSVDLSNFDTSKVTWMSSMFRNCSSLISVNLSNFDTSKVMSMMYMFVSCENLTSIDLNNFDTSNVTDMECMFCDCSSLTSVNWSNFDTSNVTTMGGMFYNCSSLTSVDVSNFDTSNVTDMGSMFYNCESLRSVDVSNFNTSKVTTMGGMFYNCSSLTSVDVSNFDTSNVTDMGYMFYDCNRLTSVDVSNFNTSNVTDMGYMFCYCKSLTSVDVSNFNTSNVTDMGHMFYDCNRLTSVDLSNFDISKVTSTDDMFDICYSLIKIKSPYNLKVDISLLFVRDGYVWRDNTGKEYDSIPAGITESITLMRYSEDEFGDAEDQNGALKSAIYKYGSKQKDILAAAHTVEKSHAPFTIECSANTKEKVTYYIDTQKSTLRSTDGIFKVNPADLEAGKNVSIIVKESNGKAYRTTTLLKVEDPNALKESTIKLGDKASFQLGEDVPFVGGSKATFNIPSVPVAVVVEDGMVKAGFNIKRDVFSYNSAEGVTTTTKKKSFKQQWDDIKWNMQKTGYINKDYKGYLQQCDLQGGLPGVEGKVTFSIAGYAEGTWSSDSQMETIGGEIVVCISGKGVARKQIVWIVPISLRVEATASGSVTAKLTYDFVNSQLKGDLSLLGSVSLEPFAGIGVSDYLSVGAYGKGTANIYATLISSTKPLGLDKFTIQGQAGIKGYVAKKEVINIKLIDSKEYTVYERTSGRSRTTSSYALGTSAKSALNNNLEDESTSWVEYNDSDVNVKSVFQAAEDNTAKTLVKNIYGACTPQVAQIDDIKVYGYVDETGTRENADQTVAKYVVYDEKTGTSSQEAMIDDDGTADYKLQFISDGEQLYAVYLDADCIFGNTEPDINTYANSFKVTVARFDQAERKFIKVGTYNKNDCYCYNPTLAITDDGFQLSWCENNDNEVMALTDTNQLYCVSCEKDGTIIQNIDSIGQDLKAVTSLVVDPQGNILYFEDKDNLLTTPEQRISYYEASTKQLKNITNCASESNNVSRLSYQNKPGSDQENILCLCDGIVSYFDSKNESIKYCDESAYVGNTATYYVRDNAIFYADNAIHKLSYNGKSYIPCDVTEEEGEITSFATDGNSFLYSVGTADYKTPEDKEFETSCDLKYISGIDKKQVTLKDVFYDYNDFTRGEDALVKISLTNTGLENLDGVKVIVADKDSNVVYSEDIMQTFVAGDTTDIEISLEDVESLASGNMNISVTGLREEAGVLKEETEKSSEVVDLNKAELSVEGDVRVDENNDTYIHVDAINSGTKATTAVITLKNGEESLFEKEVEIAADSTEGIDINDLDIPEQEQLYTVNIKTQDPEFYTSDNEIQIAVMKLNVPTANEVDAEKYDRVDDKKVLEGIKAVKTKTEYEVGDAITVDDLKVTAVYGDKSEVELDGDVYETNVVDLKTTKVGKLILIVTYTEGKVTKTADIILTVKDKPSGGTEKEKILESIKAVKTKTEYEVGDTITVDDLKVTAVYDDESEVELENTAYTTNVDKLNTTIAGTKQLKITYEEKGVKKIATIIIVVKTKAPTQPPTPTEPTTPTQPTTPAQPTAPAQTATQTPVTSTQTATPVIPGNVSGLKVKALGKKKVSVKWKTAKDAFAYVVQVSTKKNFKKGNKLRIVRKTKFTWKGLKKGKTYYVRVRVCANGQYGEWSKVKKVKVR